MTAGLPPPFSLVAVDRIDSTNDEARRLVAQGAGHGTVIWAKEQTAGRGRRGRAWVSPPGNLHCSIVLHPGPSLAHAPQLTFVAAVALRDALAEFLPSAPFQCKWPNDLLVAGRKVAGMLLEVAGPWIILGVGVNVAHTPDASTQSLLYPTASLLHFGSGADPFDVLASFCDSLGRWYDRWNEHGFAAIREAWLANAAGLGEAITVRLADGVTLEGRFGGLDGQGALMLDKSDGSRQAVLAGDVFFTV